MEFSPAPILIWKKNCSCSKHYWPVSISRLIESAHDVSEGGLFVTLAESGFNRELGFEVVAQIHSYTKRCILVWGSQSRVVVTVRTGKNAAEFMKGMHGISLLKNWARLQPAMLKVDGEHGEISGNGKTI